MSDKNILRFGEDEYLPHPHKLQCNPTIIEFKKVSLLKRIKKLIKSIFYYTDAPFKVG